LIWRGFADARVPSWLRDLIRVGRCSGVVLFGRNVESPEQVHGISLEASASFQGPGALPVAVDQEGGRVARLGEPHFTTFPPARVMAQAPYERLVEAGRAMGEEMSACGINVDFAPVVDVQDGNDGVIGDRAFSGDPDSASMSALAWLEGLESSGVAGCVKHFPGHGDASCDSHVDLPRADGGLERIRAHHLRPFAAAISARVRAVMVAHLLVPDIDPDRPASLSPALVDGLLRSEMGFEGLAVTDDLEMGAVTRRLSVAEAAVMAVEAGCDALLVCESRDRQEEAVEALVREAERSAAFRARIARSASRLDRFALSLRPPGEYQPGLVRSDDHLRIAAGFTA
jgi:beta-N-acetylhexosaminidase